MPVQRAKTGSVRAVKLQNITATTQQDTSFSYNEYAMEITQLLPRVSEWCLSLVITSIID